MKTSHMYLHLLSTVFFQILLRRTRRITQSSFCLKTTNSFRKWTRPFQITGVVHLIYLSCTVEPFIAPGILRLIAGKGITIIYKWAESCAFYLWHWFIHRFHLIPQFLLVNEIEKSCCFSVLRDYQEQLLRLVPIFYSARTAHSAVY